MRAAVGSERWPPEQIHPALHEDHADAGDHGSSAPDQSTADQWKNNEEQVRREPRTDRAQCRSGAPDDLRGPRRQDETRRTVDPGHSSDGPSWIDLAENRVTTTESRFAAYLNRLLQQNLPMGDIVLSCPNFTGQHPGFRSRSREEVSLARRPRNICTIGRSHFPRPRRQTETNAR